MQLTLRLEDLVAATSRPVEKKGVVYTRDWVVDLMLDLAGYRSSQNLASCLAVEPAAGAGAFFLPMVRRLINSCQTHGVPLSATSNSLRAYELDPATAAALRTASQKELFAAGASNEEANAIAQHWITTGDYLMEAPLARRADFVVGNPPYIRYDDLPEGLLTTYRTMYHTMRDRGDIYVGFFEAALSQLLSGGVCALICADRWMLNAYGSELRRFISKSFSVEAVIEMHNAPAFEDDVSAYPAIVVIRRAPQKSAVVASAGPAAGSIPDGSVADVLRDLARGTPKRVDLPGFRATTTDHWFKGKEPWPCTSPERLALLQRLEGLFSPLEDHTSGTKVGIGVASGADRVFVTTDQELVEHDRLLPLVLLC